MAGVMTSHIHLVLLPDRAGLYGAWLDREVAHGHAKAIKGVVAEVEVSGDYRDRQEDPR
jgi:hypothetical protein